MAHTRSGEMEDSFLVGTRRFRERGRERRSREVRFAVFIPRHAAHEVRDLVRS